MELADPQKLFQQIRKRQEQAQANKRISYEGFRPLLQEESQQMIISWPNLFVGSLLGGILGIVGDWQIGTRLRKRYMRRTLTKEYGLLAGHYLNYRVREDGTHEPAGTVELAWEPQDGLLEATGFLATGNPEWHSYIKMSTEYAGTGTGHYNNVNSIHGGIQQVIYSKQTRSFHVMGTSHAQKEFAHHWQLKE